MRPLCNFKLDRILKLFDNSCDKIIIFWILMVLKIINPDMQMSERHVPDGLKTPVKIILADYEIEEWICISKNLKWKHSNLPKS